jgi:Outer membrane lipoprotein carrier protein LolA-like
MARVKDRAATRFSGLVLEAGHVPDRQSNSEKARQTLCRAMLSLAALTVLGASPPPPPVLQNVLARIAHLPARQARFTEEKHLASLTAPLHSAGILIYRPPAYLEKSTSTPRPERMVIDGDTLTLAEGDSPPRSVGLDENPALRGLADTLRAVVGGDLATLQRLYSVQEQGDVANWRLVLTPSDPALRDALFRVTVDGSDTNIRQIDMQQRNGDDDRIDVQAGS